MGDGRGAVEELQVGAARVSRRPGGELDDRDGRVAGDEVGRDLVDAGGDPLERGAEPVAVRRVLQDRRREVEDEDDVGAIRPLGSGLRHEAAEDDQKHHDDRGQCLCSRSVRGAQGASIPAGRPGSRNRGRL
jgi:hypothetical protein